MKIQQNGLRNQYTPSQGAIKTPSMAFLENKRREEEKYHLHKENGQ